MPTLPLSANSRPNALTIPVEAIQRSDNKTTRAGGRCPKPGAVREVQIGIESSNNVEILGGLNEGERVIVGNLGSYQPGEVVKPKQCSNRRQPEHGRGVAVMSASRSSIRFSS